jgi:thymidylate kinase
MADRSYHERVRARYLELAQANPGQWIVIDAQETPEQVEMAIWRQLQLRLAIA